MTMLSRRWISLIVLAWAAAGWAHAEKESLLIGRGDMLHIQVFDTPELEQHARVTDSGDVPLVMGGAVHVVDLTPAEAARVIEDALRKGQFLLAPRVAVAVEAFATQRVSVVGEVRAPGAYEINTPRSILDVLTMAGGLTEVADREVLIERRGGRERVPYFLSNNPNSALDAAIQVNPGDSVIVPKAGIVYVLGEVARPGGYTMTNNDAQITVLQLIARAGGTNHSAVPSHARLIRKRGDTHIEETLPLSAMQKGKRADVPLQPDDIVYVPFSYLKNFAANGTGIAASAASAAIYRF
jgi:polysaccharide export outer membrane protein